MSPSEAEAVLNGCARRWEAVVATTSPLVEDLRRWGDRFGVSRAILANASSVLGVCEASPRRVVRFGEWLADARPAGRVSVVIDKAPARSPFVVGEVREPLKSLPFDRRVVRGEWDATMPRLGPFTRGMRRMIGPLQLLIAETAAK